MLRYLTFAIGLVSMIAVSTTLASAEDASAPNPKCTTHVNTDQGSGGVQVGSCDDGTGSVGFGGPIKDVDVAHPVGKGDAFLPKAGRDTQRVVQDVGHGTEHFAHEVGKAASKFFGW